MRAAVNSFSVGLPNTGFLPVTMVAAAKVVHALVSVPDLLFLGTLSAMLFRPPDLKVFPADRVAFIVLLSAVCLRFLLTRTRPHTFPATWPILCLLALGLWGAATQPYDPQSWSLLAAKWIVPFVMFHIAGQLFDCEIKLRRLEVFCVIALAYLACVSIFSFLDLKSLIYPKFILDEGVGIHADRARGPLLQAVANGVMLNILGLLALHSFDRGRITRMTGAALFMAVPLALLATRTRAVWLGAITSVVLLALRGPGVLVRRTAVAYCVVGVLAGVAFIFYDSDSRLADRLQDRSPVDFRMDMYRAGWQMFTEKPVTGWGSEENIQPELRRRIRAFHPEYYVFHNTYLELAVQRGVIGLGLYAWLALRLFQLGSKAPGCHGVFLYDRFGPLWFVILVVYFINASAVVMNYQFVNALLFAIAGILAAQKRQALQNWTGVDDRTR